MNRHKYWITAAATCLLGLTAGCALTVAQAAHSAYDHVRGDLMGIVPYPLESVIPAAARVIQEREGYDLSDRSASYLDASFVAYDNQARKVCLDLSRTDENQTKIQIRIGMVGDRLESSMLFSQIVNKLAQTARKNPATSPSDLRYSAGL